MKRAGLLWTIEMVDRHGRVIERDQTMNLVPVEGLNHMLGVTLKQVPQVATWYVALYEGDYTPTPALTAATFPGLAMESTAYSGATRPAYDEGAISAGGVSNADSLAQFAFTADKTIRGGALLSSPTKGGTGGVILSAARFPSPRTLTSGSTLKVRVTSLALSA